MGLELGKADAPSHLQGDKTSRKGTRHPTQASLSGRGGVQWEAKGDKNFRKAGIGQQPTQMNKAGYNGDKGDKTLGKAGVKSNKGKQQGRP